MIHGGFAASSCVRFRAEPDLSFVDRSDRGGDTSCRLDGYELFAVSDLHTNTLATCQGGYFISLYGGTAPGDAGGSSGGPGDVILVRYFSSEEPCASLSDVPYPATDLACSGEGREGVCADAWFVDVEVL